MTPQTTVAALAPRCQFRAPSRRGVLPRVHTPVPPLLGEATVCLTVVGAMVWSEPRLFHWLVVPVTACGIWACQAARRWARGELDLFDPEGLIGVAGIHFFFLAPLLFVFRDGQMSYVENPPDWRPWLGAMAALNLIGILCFVWSAALACRAPRSAAGLVGITPARLLRLFAGGLVCALIATAVVMTRVGGVAGMIAEHSQSSGVFAGLGSARVFSQSLPLLALLSLTALHRPSHRATRATVYALLVVAGVLQFLVAGFLGSRAAVVWPLFFASGILHYFWRRLDWRDMATFAIAALAFSYTYAFYKSLGDDVMEWVQSGASREELEQHTGRGLDMLLIGDLSRTDVQAFILYRLSDPNRDYALQLGGTYLWSWTPLFPAWLWEGKPPNAGKVAAGTDIQSGRDTYRLQQVSVSSRVYGLAGESMLNFGPPGVPVAFAVWGYLLGRWRRFRARIESGDVRLALAPIVSSLFLLALYMDLDNVLAHVVLHSGGPLAVILIGIASCRRAARAQACARARSIR